MAGDRIGIVPWGDPWGRHGQRLKWGLRVNGAYVVRNLKPVLFNTREEAEAARKELKAKQAALQSQAQENRKDVS